MFRVVVAGGANTDIVGVVGKALIAGDSNPGTVTFSAGGVARNMGENLARLGAQVELVTAIGDDDTARLLADHCREVGIGIGHSLTLSDTPGSVYLALLDEQGDLAVAISDMRALDRLTPELLGEALRGVDPPDALVLDTNLTAETISRACDLFPGVPVFADCVSVAKAPRIRESLAHIDALHLNALEAEEITGVAIGDRADGASSAASRLHELGVGSVFITEGARGAFYSSAGETGRIRALPVDVVDVTGAGDAFMAGVIWGTLGGMSTSAAARMGVAAASITLASASTVAPGIDAVTVSALAGEMLR